MQFLNHAPTDVSVCFSLIIEFYLLALIVLFFCHVLGYFSFLITYLPISFLIRRYLAKVTFYIVIIQNLYIIVTWLVWTMGTLPMHVRPSIIWAFTGVSWCWCNMPNLIQLRQYLCFSNGRIPLSTALLVLIKLTK